jgi:hypothetical protein
MLLLSLAIGLTAKTDFGSGLRIGWLVGAVVLVAGTFVIAALACLADAGWLPTAPMPT